MLFGSLSFMTAAGTAYSAYQSYTQETAEYRIIVLSAAGGLILSLFLQALSGRFSKADKPLGVRIVRVLIGDATSFVSNLFLPLAVIYGFAKKNGEIINQYSFGFIQIEPTLHFKGRDVTHLYPGLVGVNLGFFAGEMVGKVFDHFFKG
jgi:hypothetical protein